MYISHYWISTSLHNVQPVSMRDAYISVSVLTECTSRVYEHGRVHRVIGA